MSAVTAVLLDPVTLAEDVVLDESWGRAWQDQLNEPGSGSLNIQVDDADRAGIAWQSLILLKLDAVAAWTMVVEAFDRHSLTAGEEADQFEQLTGRGLLSEWDRASMFPPYALDRRPYADQRVLGWSDPSYAEHVHPNAVVNDPALFEGRPEDWPDDTAQWIWSQDTSAGAPVGPVFFWTRFTSADARRVAIWAAADDRFRLFLDGVPILSDEAGYYRGTASQVELELSAGDHFIAVGANNENAAQAGFLFALMTIQPNGDITSSGIVSDATWRQLAYPADDPPGIRVGQAIRVFLEEAQDRGELTGWTLDFTDDEDSDGNTWDGFHNFPVPVGLDGLSLLRQLSEAYCEVSAAPAARVLRAWNLGGRGSVLATALEPGSEAGNEVSGNLVELGHQGQGKVVNVLLIRYGNGFTTVDHAGSIAIHGRQVGHLRLEGVSDKAEAENIGAKLLDVQAWARVATTATTDPEDSADIPFVDYGVGDWILCPDETGAAISQRVRALTVSEDEVGLAGYTHELRDVMLELDDLYQRVLKRANLGSLGGRSDSSNFVDPNPVPRLTAPVEQPDRFTILDGTPSGTISPIYRFRGGARNTRVRIDATGPGTADTVLSPRRNGVNYGPVITLPAADTSVEVAEGEQFHAGDELQIDLITAGGHTGVVVTVVTAR